MSLAIRMRVYKLRGTFFFCSISSKSPRGINSVTIIKLPGTVQAPINCTMFGWGMLLKVCTTMLIICSHQNQSGVKFEWITHLMISTSRRKDCSVFASRSCLSRIFTATVFCLHEPFHTQPKDPFPNTCKSSTSSALICGWPVLKGCWVYGKKKQESVLEFMFSERIQGHILSCLFWGVWNSSFMVSIQQFEKILLIQSCKLKILLRLLLVPTPKSYCWYFVDEK